MAECPYFDFLLVVPRIRVQNANAISSPLTHGFPAMSAFIGLMWALERKVHAAGLDLQFNAVGVVAHDYDEQTTDERFVSAFRLTRNPIGKDGTTAAIVEEGRMHLDISLIFGVQSKALDRHEQLQDIAELVKQILDGMRIAGGTVIPSELNRTRQMPYLLPFGGDEESKAVLFSRLKMRLLPGFTLVERQDVLEERYETLREENESVTRLDAWLSLSRINWRWQGGDASEEKGEWRHDRKGLGWVVPIPVGFGALTDVQPAGSVKNARDSTTPFCFVESLYGIGQWLSPHRLHNAEQLLWYPDSRPQEGLYRCRNDYAAMRTSILEFDAD